MPPRYHYTIAAAQPKSPIAKHSFEFSRTEGKEKGLQLLPVEGDPCVAGAQIFNTYVASDEA